ncbi:integral membrane-like protein [Halobacteriales archaeon QS_1_68_20]|nr:MAG: integral membrane-like protein [Halobacteriales archaeon QS_1_68_20]
MSRNTPVGRTVFVALFVTALVTAQVTASKVLAFGLPVELPMVGAALFVPGGVLAYAATFFASDCYAELYGRREAQLLVNVGFVMNFVMLGLVWFAIEAPVAPVTNVPAGEFEAVLGSSTSIVAGSLLAYLVSQNWDVYVFHRIRQWTDGRYLWLRNVGSTASSQLIDTVIFVAVAFAFAPALLQGAPLPGVGDLLPLVVGQYVVKVLIAVGDTPFVYAAVRYLRETEFVAPRPTRGD